MTKAFKTLILSAAVAATTMIPLAEAQADHRWRHHQRDRIVRQNDNSGLIAAGIVGLAVGAIIAGSVAPRRVETVPVRPRHDPAYYPPEPVSSRRDEPRVIYADEQDEYYAPPEPWTRDWYRYCHSRFRSFDPESGTYLGYDGYRHFCQAR